MMRNLPIIALVLFCIVLPSSAAMSAPRDGHDHLSWAERLLSGLDETNTGYVYQRTAKGIAWKGHGSDESYAYTDCSGFLNSLLQHAYGFDAPMLAKWLGVDARKTGPTANRYYWAIMEQRGFQRIVRIGDVRSGDILAIYYPEDKRNTGHVMLVRAVPKKVEPVVPRVEKTEQWKVSVMDSTVSPHGRADTRCHSNGFCWSGVGSGEIRLYVNDSGEFEGYSWSMAPKSKFIPSSRRPLAVGRLTSPVAAP